MMEPYLWWVVAGIALVITELATGTFYLLVLGIAAFAGAGVAWFGQSLWLAAVVSAAVAACGVIVVNRYRAPRAGGGEVPLDVGQNAVFESWRSENDRLARVRYRNAQWDARVIDEKIADEKEAGAGAIAAGRVLHIRGVEGSTLIVSVTPA